MSTSPSLSWRNLFRRYLASARVSVLAQLLQDDIFHNFDSTSTLLMSNVDTATELLRWYAEVHEHGSSMPVLLIAQELSETTDIEPLNKRFGLTADVQSPQQLGSYSNLTHAFLHIHTDRSEHDVLNLLQRVYGLLTPDGKLAISRRKRDGLADILYAAGVPVPGRRRGCGTATPTSEDDGLASIASAAGFAPNQITSLEKKYILQEEQSQRFLDDVKAVMTLSINYRNNDEQCGSKFDNAVEREMKEHGGILLVATVVVATKSIADDQYTV